MPKELHCCTCVVCMKKEIIAICRSIDKGGGGEEGLETALIGVFLFFIYWCTPSKLIMQNYHLVEVSKNT